MVAGDLHGPTEGVLDIVGNVYLDGAHLQAAFLGDAVNGQCQREDESEAGAGDGGESVEDSPGPHRPDDFGQAGADERHQKCQADGARVGGEGQEGGIGHGECETTEGEPAPWPARAQLLHAAPQHGEGDDSCCDRMPGSGSDVGQGGHPAHQRPCCAQDDHVEGVDEGERRPADRVSHGDSSEVQQGSEEGEPENEAQSGSRPHAASSNRTHEQCQAERCRPPHIRGREGDGHGQARQCGGQDGSIAAQCDPILRAGPFVAVVCDRVFGTRVGGCAVERCHALKHRAGGASVPVRITTRRRQAARGRGRRMSVVVPLLDAEQSVV